jgi:hypothetical protein
MIGASGDGAQQRPIRSTPSNFFADQEPQRYYTFDELMRPPERGLSDAEMQGRRGLNDAEMLQPPARGQGLYYTTDELMRPPPGQFFADEQPWVRDAPVQQVRPWERDAPVQLDELTHKEQPRSLGRLFAITVMLPSSSCRVTRLVSCSQ